jgi:flagellar hook-length control protein FliK
LPALRERLAEQGVRIERFDVDLMQRQPGGMPDRPGDQQREAPPPRAEPPVRRLNQPTAPSRGPLATNGPTTGLNVIV